MDGNGETPTVGYVALVWLVEGTQDSAAGVRLGRKDADSPKGPDLIGVIAAVSADGKRITLEIPAENKNDPPTKVQLTLTDKTKFSYFGVAAGEQTPTVGYSAWIWLVKGSKDSVNGIRLGRKE